MSSDTPGPGLMEYMTVSPATIGLAKGPVESSSTPKPREAHGQPVYGTSSRRLVHLLEAWNLRGDARCGWEEGHLYVRHHQLYFTLSAFANGTYEKDKHLP